MKRGLSANKLQLLDELREIVARTEKETAVSGSAACVEREHTLEEVGLVLGVTRERVRQIEKQALAKLRQGIRKEALKDFSKT